MTTHTAIYLVSSSMTVRQRLALLREGWVDFLCACLRWRRESEASKWELLRELALAPWKPLWWVLRGGQAHILTRELPARGKRERIEKLAAEGKLFEGMN